MSVRIILADDHPLLLAGNTQFLKSKGYNPNFEIPCDQLGVFVKCEANKGWSERHEILL